MADTIYRLTWEYLTPKGKTKKDHYDYSYDPREDGELDEKVSIPPDCELVSVSVKKMTLY